MSTIIFDNFGGEVPRVSPRALPPNGAQLNQNLVATSTEFRPAQNVQQVYAPRPGGDNSRINSQTGQWEWIPERVNTLFRRESGADGKLRTDVTTDWAATEYSMGFETNAVKSQVNTGNADLYYFSDNTGIAPMQAATEASSVILGVPPPSQPVITVPTKNYLSKAQATTWVNDTFAQTVANYIGNELNRYYSTQPYLARYNGASNPRTTKAGLTTVPTNTDIFWFENASGAGLRGNSAPEPWNFFAKIPASANPAIGNLSTVIGITYLGGTFVGEYAYLPISVLPSWKDIDNSESPLALASALISENIGVRNPYDNSLFFVNDWNWAAPDPSKRSLQNFVAIINEYLKPANHPDVVALRTSLQKEFQNWSDVGAKAMKDAVNATTTATPTPTFRWTPDSSVFPGTMGPNDPVRLKYQNQVFTATTDAAAFAFQPTGNAAVQTVTSYTTSGDGGQNTVYSTTNSDLWFSWNFAYQQFKAALNKYTADTGGTQASKDTVNAAMKASADKCADISHQIEQLWADMMTGLKQKIADLFINYGLENVFAPVVLNDEKVMETRFYVTTWVGLRGEESAPSPVSTAFEVDQYDKPKLQLPIGFPNFPNYVGSARTVPIKALRLYRSNAGSDTAAFQFVAELPYGSDGKPSTTLPPIYIPIVGQVIASTGVVLSGTIYTWTDLVKSEALGEVLPSTTWALQPFRKNEDGSYNGTPFASVVYTKTGVGPYARGLINTAGSCMAAFIDNNVYFCEPGIPYAWPEAYRKTVPYPIVGLASVGEAVFVATMGKPSWFVGSDPANMAPYHLPDHQACVSAKSIVVGGGGVWYASQDGYCFATTQGVQIATRELFSVDDWKALNPSKIIGAVHDNVLHFWWVTNEGGVGSYALDMNARKLVSGRAPYGKAPMQVQAVFDDVPTQSLFVAGTAGIYQMFGSPYVSPGYWRSRIEVLKNQEPLAWMKVEGNQDTSNPVYVVVIGDGQNIRKAIDPGYATAVDPDSRGADFTNDYKHTFIVTDTKPVRLPPGRYLEYEIFIKSTARITRIYLSSNTDELRRT